MQVLQGNKLDLALLTYCGVWILGTPAENFRLPFLTWDIHHFPLHRPQLNHLSERG